VARCQLVFLVVCCLKNVSSSEECGKAYGRDKVSHPPLPSFSLSFILFLISLGSWRCGLLPFGTRVFVWRMAAMELRLLDFLEPAFSGAGLHTTVSQNSLQCTPTRTALSFLSAVNG
jgi:hypothetical protein